MINITVTGAKELVQRFKGMGPDTHAALLAVIQKDAVQLQNHVVADKLQGQVLRHLSGALGDSIKSAVDDNGSSVYGRVFSNNTVNYAAFWEFGFHGSEEVRAHERLATVLFGKPVDPFIQQVSAHSRTVNQDARSFLRSSLADMAAQITDDIQKAVANALKKGETR